MHGGRWGREVQHALLLVKNLHSNAGSVASILQGQIRYVRKTKRHEIHFFQLLNIILFAGSLFTSELPHKVTFVYTTVIIDQDQGAPPLHNRSLCESGWFFSPLCFKRKCLPVPSHMCSVHFK